VVILWLSSAYYLVAVWLSHGLRLTKRFVPKDLIRSIFFGSANAWDIECFSIISLGVKAQNFLGQFRLSQAG
jgi:hypothetical protein